MFMPRPTSQMSLEEKVQLLMDEREIRDVVYRDCRAKSRSDRQLMKTCFFEDAVDHHQPFFEAKIMDFISGPQAAEAQKAAGEMIQYFAPQILIEVDGDTARVESYILSAKTFHERAENGDKIVRVSGMRNLDRFERRAGEWRIAERWFIGEWGFFEQVPPLSAKIGNYGAGTETGKLIADPNLEQIQFSRDLSDPSYTVWDKSKIQ